MSLFSSVCYCLSVIGQRIGASLKGAGNISSAASTGSFSFSIDALLK
ncbi:MAG TPA: hypothetical protein VM537_06440 [Anaerolineae bacterium]|nr:hypothetical protein [Anaerolineae bacterium]